MTLRSRGAGGAAVRIGLGVCLLATQAAAQEEVRGHLLIAGGGELPAEVLQAALALCGAEPRVVVLPQASAEEDRGRDAAERWRRAGAARVDVLDPLEPDAARATLAAADLIWLGGGSQERLVSALQEHDLIGVLRARYRAGAVVGGTSAGAAAMGEVMLTGKAELERLVAGGSEVAPGLGLWPEALVDQHFLARRRHNRLLAAVLADPRRLGVGIDEGTAVVVSGATLRVLGAGCVLVLDARRAEVQRAAPGAPPSARDLCLHVLRAGDAWTWRAP